METTNTRGLSSELRSLLADWMIDGKIFECQVPGQLRAEMVSHFGSPRQAGYMSEETLWELDDDDQSAIER